MKPPFLISPPSFLERISWMDKISLYIDTRDRLYAVRLAEYFSKYFASSMDVFLSEFGQDEDNFALKSQGPLVLLTDDPEAYRGPKADQILLLSEQNGIDPYQSARDIADRILSACHSRKEENAKLLKKEQQLSLLEDPRLGFGKMIAFCASAGGIGLSTLVLSSAMALKGTGFSVLVLTLDPVFPSCLSLSAGGSFGDLCYSLLSEEREIFNRRIRELPSAAKGWEENIRFLPPPLRPDDLLDLSEDELRDLMEDFRDCYDVTMIDLGSRLYQPHRQILSESDRIFYLQEASEEGSFRSEKLPQGWIPEEKTTRFLIENLRTEKASRTEKEMRRMLPPDQIWLTKAPELREKGDIRRLGDTSIYLETVRKAVLETCGG